MDKTPLELLRELDEQRSKLIEDATKQAHTNAETAIEQLNALGYHYRMVSDARKGPSRRSKPLSERFCEICNIGGHDKRNHINQDPKKKFTKNELTEKGLLIQ